WRPEMPRPLAGKPLVANQRRPLGRTVGRELQQPWQRLALAGQLGVGQPKAVVPSQVVTSSRLTPPVEAVVGGVVAISGVAKQRRTTGGGARGAAGDRGAV